MFYITCKGIPLATTASNTHYFTKSTNLTGSDCKLYFVLMSSGHILLFITGNKSCCSFKRKRPPRFTLTLEVWFLEGEQFAKNFENRWSDYR